MDAKNGHERSWCRGWHHELLMSHRLRLWPLVSVWISLHWRTHQLKSEWCLDWKKSLTIHTKTFFLHDAIQEIVLNFRLYVQWSFPVDGLGWGCIYSTGGRMIGISVARFFSAISKIWRETSELMTILMLVRCSTIWLSQSTVLTFIAFQDSYIQYIVFFPSVL